jgi:hypothetical protein
MNLRSTLILSALVRIGRTGAVFLAPPPAAGWAQLPIRQTLD